ncbi:hypothetical protein [Psychrobacter sp. 16-MNA-CIBAN-0192]|uniref:hypothetical protein n=1 Tax=Psychrobacter sp. 16-MNA-CIBAN-0192 TaxID=3140448 RepID=UPI00331DEE00
MFRLNRSNKSSSHILLSPISKGIVTSICLVTSLISIPAYASNHKPPTPITRSEAANPSNFKFISVNGRAATYSSAPCPVEKGLLTCGLGKLALINSFTNEIDADYDLAQSFVFPSKSQPRTVVVVVTRSGLMDDSVSAERYRVSFKLEGKPSNLSWNWVQYGVQYQCARGNKAGKWTKGLCP